MNNLKKVCNRDISNNQHILISARKASDLADVLGGVNLSTSDSYDFKTDFSIK